MSNIQGTIQSYQGTAGGAYLNVAQNGGGGNSATLIATQSVPVTTNPDVTGDVDPASSLKVHKVAMGNLRIYYFEFIVNVVGNGGGTANFPLVLDPAPVGFTGGIPLTNLGIPFVVAPGGDVLFTIPVNTLGVYFTTVTFAMAVTP